MVERSVQTPVALFVFNRPDTTAQVFAAVARARPAKLLVVADGPRTKRAGESERCAQTRAIVERVDWPCEVSTNYSAVNLGCRSRVSSGLDWVFSQVPEAIILEDDCVPHPTFFQFCEELLEIYRHDERIGMICGNNFQFGRRIGDGSYYFSKYTPIWGWATWRRAWKHYDVLARSWPQVRGSGLFETMTFPCERETWKAMFDGVFQEQIDTWDYQWTLSCWSQSMITVMPERNLVENIGFGPEATHTTGSGPYANMAVEAMEFPLKQPSIIAANAQADRRVADQVFAKASVMRGLANRLRRIVSF